MDTGPRASETTVVPADGLSLDAGIMFWLFFFRQVPDWCMPPTHRDSSLPQLLRLLRFFLTRDFQATRWVAGGDKGLGTCVHLVRNGTTGTLKHHPSYSSCSDNIHQGDRAECLDKNPHGKGTITYARRKKEGCPQSWPQR